MDCDNKLVIAYIPYHDDAIWILPLNTLDCKDTYPPQGRIFIWPGFATVSLHPFTASLSAELSN